MEDNEEAKREMEEEYKRYQDEFKEHTTIKYPKNWDEMEDTGIPNFISTNSSVYVNRIR